MPYNGQLASRDHLRQDDCAKRSGKRGQSPCGFDPHPRDQWNQQASRISQYRRPSGGRLRADHSQHLLRVREARPPDRPGRVTLQTKRTIVCDERTHRLDAAAARHRTVGSVECAGGPRTRQRRGPVFVFDDRVCSMGEQQFEDGGIGVAGRHEQRRQASTGARGSSFISAGRKPFWRWP